MIKKNILVPIANGVEELEAVSIIDVLRRSGLVVRVSTIEEREITGANGIKIVADSDFIDEVLDDYDAIVLPGGTEGAERLLAFAPLGKALKRFATNNNLVGAICASPAIVLAAYGLLDTKKATCYPSFKHLVQNYVDENVVVDGNIITSQGPGTALLFALRIAEILAGPKVASQVKAGMLA
jgi:protein deglycase